MVITKKILSVNQKAVADYKSGKTNVINFLVGMVMREAKKKIEFKRLQNLIIESIK
jgi:aspartyl-tRNA(Asn)/glutamyl-tRNA(Gln) amidotransferase subunit B